MTEHEQDVLTRIAFGEEEPGDKEALGRILSQHPEAHAELELMRTLCQDLGQAAVVPACQLDFARVGRAIEPCAPARRAVRLWLGFGGLTAAAAALGFFWLSRGFESRVPTTSVAQSPPVTAPREEVVASFEGEPDLAELLAEESLAMGTDASATPVSAVRQVRRAAAPALKRSVVSTKAKKPVTSILAAPTPAAEAVPTSTSDPQPSARLVVLVGEHSDPTTGAAGAVESADPASLEFRG